MSTIAVSFEVLNTKATPSIAADLAANRPAVAATGALYIATDTNVFSRYNGSAWVTIGGGGGGGISGSGTANFVPLFTAATAIGDSTMSFTAGSIGVAPSFSLGNNTNLILPFTGAAAQPIGLYIFEGSALGFNIQRVVGAPNYNRFYSGQSRLEFKLFDGGTDYFHNFFDNGRVVINGLTDLGFQLRVNGTTSFNGNSSVLGTLDTTNTITVTNSGVIVNAGVSGTSGFIGTGSGNDLLLRANSSTAVTIKTGSNRVLINTTTDTGVALNVSGTTQTTSLFLASGSITCSANGSQDIGQSALAFRNIFASTLQAGTAVNALTLGSGGTFGVQLYKTGTTSGIMYVADSAVSLSNVTLLSLESTTRGFRLPRMTTAQRTAITAVNGLMVFDTDLNHICFYDTSGAPGWRKLSYSNA